MSKIRYSNASMGLFTHIKYVKAFLKLRYECYILTLETESPFVISPQQFHLPPPPSCLLLTKMHLAAASPQKRTVLNQTLCNKL